MFQFRLFTFILALTISPSVLPCNYADDPEMQAQKANCVSASKEWSCQLNRCMTTQEAFQLRQEFQKCEQLSDEAAKEECFLKLAEEKTKVNRNARPEKSAWETLSLGTSSAYALLGAISWFSKKGGKCLSKKIMMGGSAAHLATHFLVLNQSKKRFDDIATRAKSSGNDYNAQLRAFHRLKEEQEAINKYAKKKKITYTVVTASYAGALATAILEKTGSLKMTPCEVKKTKEPKTESADKPFSLSKIKGALSIKSSTQVAVYSGIGMGLALKLRQAALKEEQQSEQNIKHIESIIAKFQGSTAAYCPEGREDLKNPRCYCYTDKGEPNTNRTKSAICQNLWKKDNVNYAVKPGSYHKQEGGRSGCLTFDGKFDPDCQCRKYKNSATGKNLCAKSSQNILIPLPLQNNLARVSEALKASDILTGASDKATLDADALSKAATQTKRYAEKLLKRYNNAAASKNIPSLPITPKFVEQATKKLVNKQMQKRFGTGHLSSSLSSLDSKAAPALSQAVKAIKQKKSHTDNAVLSKSQKESLQKG